MWNPHDICQKTYKSTCVFESGSTKMSKKKFKLHGKRKGTRYVAIGPALISLNYEMEIEGHQRGKKRKKETKRNKLNMVV